MCFFNAQFDFLNYFMYNIKMSRVKEVYNVFYDETKTINASEADPSLIFDLLKEDHIELIDKILSRKTFDINVVDEQGNNILTKLLKKGYFEIVLKHIKNKRWDINHQNNDGDTFAHILVTMNSLNTLDIYRELKKNKNFIPNLKNNEGETILDKSLKNSSTYMTAKILEDSRFNEVGVLSFKKLYDTYIKTNNYGKYSKINNLEMIICGLQGKDISPRVKMIIHYLKDNFDEIIEEVKNNKTKRIDYFLESVLFD